MKRTKTSLVLNRLLAGLGGFVIILLASVPLVFLGCLWVEREEFYSVAEKGDVELTVDNNGGTHSMPLDFG